jgi:Rod binding domain-containing protein
VFEDASWLQDQVSTLLAEGRERGLDDVLVARLIGCEHSVRELRGTVQEAAEAAARLSSPSAAIAEVLDRASPPDPHAPAS